MPGERAAGDRQGAILEANGAEAAAVGAGLLAAQRLGVLLQEGIAGAFGQTRKQRRRPPVSPAPLPVNPDNIPAELKARAQWVNWTEEPIPGRDKPAKVPYTPNTDAKASVTNPATWGTFDIALKALINRRQTYDGLGYVSTPDDGYTIIDFDNCGPTLPADAITANSYTEFSQSGTGCHTIVKGKPSRTVKADGTEIYAGLHYFACTANHVPGTPLTINDGQALLDDIVARYAKPEPEPQKNKHSGCASAGTSTLPDDEIIRLASSAANGDKFSRLFNGDTAGYASDSEADLAFCGILAFWCRTDPDAMLHIIRRCPGRSRGSSPSSIGRFIPARPKPAPYPARPRPPPSRRLTHRYSLAQRRSRQG